MLSNEKIKAVVLGHAVGDALGVPVEFCSREELTDSPIETMEGFGTYPYPAGCWSDDASMALCAMDVLAKGTCDLDAVMANFQRWLVQGEFTPTGECFDLGNTCKNAIFNYFLHERGIKDCGEKTENSNGNGSLMRIYPFVLYVLAKEGKMTDDGLQLIYSASAITHAHKRSLIGCGIYSYVLSELLKLSSKQSIYLGLAKAKGVLGNDDEFSYYKRIFQTDFAEIPTCEIKSGGYIVDTLEAALWCLLTTSSYKDCVLKAVNLGDDTDTVAAIAGSLAGALYGLNSIPKEWLDVLKRRDYIEELCNNFFNTNSNGEI